MRRFIKLKRNRFGSVWEGVRRHGLRWMLRAMVAGLLIGMALMGSEQWISAMMEGGKVEEVLPVSEGEEEVGARVQAEKEDRRQVVYVMYNARYGQLHNQVQSLVNALAHARNLSDSVNRKVTVVSPLTFSGTESDYEASFRNYKRLSGFHHPAELAGDYFNLTKLQEIAPMISHREFMASAEGIRLTKTVREKSMDYHDVDYYKTVIGVPAMNTTKKGDRTGRCQFSLAKAGYDRDPDNPVLLLPRTFMLTNLNCSESVPFWLDVFRHLVPRNELRQSVVEYFSQLPRPVVSLHLRVIGKETAAITNATLLAMFQSQVVKNYPSYGTIYVAYTPGQEQVRAAMAHVQKELPRVVSCAEMPNCGEVRSSWASSLPEESFLSTFRGKFSTVMMDSWALVMSDIFLGRKKSSMTHNVHLWRSIGVEGHPREIHHLFYDLFP